MSENYVHGYTPREDVRLVDQATTLTDILHADTVYPAGSQVLEAGCGVGAQTVILARNNPKTCFTSIDISGESLRAAKERVSAEGLENILFRQGDIYHLPFEEESFDHVFVCFVLEHLHDPVAALSELRRVLKRGGSVTVIEGDHGSTYFHPDSPFARKAVQCLVDIQAAMGGDALIGRRLYPLLNEAKFHEPRVSPKMVYVDSSRPDLVEGFTKNTFIAMVEGVKDQAIKDGMIDEAAWETAIADLNRTTAQDGTFIYTFFKGWAIR